KQILEGYKASNRLTVHILTGEEQIEILNTAFPKALSPEDQSVLFIARRLKNVAVLSRDQLVDQGQLTKSEACVKIKSLVSSKVQISFTKIIANLRRKSTYG